MHHRAVLATAKNEVELRASVKRPKLGGMSQATLTHRKALLHLLHNKDFPVQLLLPNSI